MLERFSFLYFFLSVVVCTYHSLAQDSRLPASDTNNIFQLQIENQLEQSDKLFNRDIRNSLLLSKEALKKAHDINNPRLIAEAKLSIGKCYEFLGVNEEALFHLSEALNIFIQLKDEQKRAMTLRQIGYIYYYSGEYNHTLKYFNEVYTIGNQLNDTSLIIAAIIGKGQVYGNTNRLDSAGLLFRDAMLLSGKSGDLSTEVQSLFYIGDVHLFSGRIFNALEIFHQVENNYDLERINSKLVSSLYNSITSAYIKTGNLPLAQKYNNLSYLSLQKYPRLTNQMIYYLYKFRIDSIKGDFFTAIQSYQKYKALSDSIHQKSFAEKRANFEIAFELERKDAEIEKLKLDNQIKDLKIRQNLIIRYGSLVLVALFLVVIVQAFRHIRKSKINNQVLQNQKEELLAANEEITTKSNDLNEKNTELEALLEELKTTQEQLVQSEKMASLGILAAGIAHEINNPLNFIQGGITGLETYFAENLKDHLEKVNPLLNGIQVGISRASSIITGLTQYTARNNESKSSFNLHELIDNCLQILFNQFIDKVIIHKDYCPQPPIIKGIKGKLQQALMNILINASQAVENNGTVRISTKSGMNGFFIIIEDNGCGIDKENLGKIFDPFFTTKEPGKGTGLGLAITYNIIQEHGGTIEVLSTPGKGTTVMIKFPMNITTEH